MSAFEDKDVQRAILAAIAAKPTGSITIEKLGQSKERTEMPPLILNGGRSEQELFGSVPDAIGYFLACFLP